MFDVTQSRELQATVLAFKTAPRRVRTFMRTAARKRLNALWVPGLRGRIGAVSLAAGTSATRFLRQMIVRGARAKVESDSFTMTAANGRALKGGLSPAFEWPAAEFGFNARRNADGRALGGNLPPRNEDGWVAWPTAREAGPKIVAGWVEGAVAGIVQGAELETVGA